MRKSMKGKLIAKRSGSRLSRTETEPMFCIGEVVSEDDLFYTVRGFEFKVGHNDDSQLEPYPITDEETFDIPKSENPYVVKPKKFLGQQVYQILEQWDNDITAESFRRMRNEIRENEQEPFNPVNVTPLNREAVDGA